MRVTTTTVTAQPTPWHVWVVGILSLLWNGSGAYTIMMAQAGRLPGLTGDEAAYYAAQPLWFVLVTNVALLAAVAGAVAVLLRSRTAVWLFATSLAAIVVTNAYDLATGASRALANEIALVVTALIVVLAVLQLAYVWTMRIRGVLR
jgi:hypothetical protein